jgi:hypothetical protein
MTPYITHRDWLAAQAMKSVIIAHANNGDSGYVADASYQIADRMLVAAGAVEAAGGSEPVEQWRYVEGLMWTDFDDCQPEPGYGIQTRTLWRQHA